MGQVYKTAAYICFTHTQILSQYYWKPGQHALLKVRCAMKEQIYGIATIFNFNVHEKFILWKEYEIAIDSISVFSTGVSTKFFKKQKKRGKFSKILSASGAMLTTALQIIDEDTAPERLDTLKTSLNLYGNDVNLPSMNFCLFNGMAFEITFTDLFTYRDSVKAVKSALINNTNANNIQVNSNEIVITKSDFNGNMLIIEKKEDKSDENY